jgi:hypothetical protein
MRLRSKKVKFLTAQALPGLRKMPLGRRSDVILVLFRHDPGLSRSSGD